MNKKRQNEAIYNEIELKYNRKIQQKCKIQHIYNIVKNKVMFDISIRFCVSINNILHIIYDIKRSKYEKKK